MEQGHLLVIQNPFSPDLSSRTMRSIRRVGKEAAGMIFHHTPIGIYRQGSISDRAARSISSDPGSIE